jgi:enoyl-CoA hydratase/carnithine racemase
MTLTTFIDPPTARLQLNAPHSLNALNLDMGKTLQQALAEIESNPLIKVVIIESLVKKAFSVGIDLKEFSTHNTPEYRREFLETWRSLHALTKPIIVAINGYAFGGGLELALMGDILIASETAVFAQPELSVGTIPGMGATQRLPRRIGMANAASMVFTSMKIDAATALNWGLVSNVVPADQLQQTVMDTANLIASKSLPMLIKVKAALRMAEEAPLHQGLNYEEELFLSTFSLEDQKEGFEAFLQKRPPIFKDC